MSQNFALCHVGFRGCIDSSADLTSSFTCSLENPRTVLFNCFTNRYYNRIRIGSSGLDDCYNGFLVRHLPRGRRRDRIVETGSRIEDVNSTLLGLPVDFSSKRMVPKAVIWRYRYNTNVLSNKVVAAMASLMVMIVAGIGSRFFTVDLSGRNRWRNYDS